MTRICCDQIGCIHLRCGTCAAEEIKLERHYFNEIGETRTICATDQPMNSLWHLHQRQIPSVPPIPDDQDGPLIGANFGGCWFCQRRNHNMVFSREFDTYLHESCLKKALEQDPLNGEAQIIFQELHPEQAKNVAKIAEPEPPEEA